VTREEIDLLIARERPGWRVIDITEVSDESGPSYEVLIASGHQRRTITIAEDGVIVGEQDR
jgi:hypothetical protein